MNVEIYTVAGKLVREVECTQLVQLGDTGYIQLLPTKIITNHVVIWHHDNRDREWSLAVEQPLYDVTLTMGDTIKQWKGVKAIAHYRKAIEFYHNDKWHMVIGETLIEEHT